MLSRLLPAPKLARPVVLLRRLPSHLLTRAVSKRFLSAHPAVPPSKREQIRVPCRSNGSVDIDIFHASTPSSPVLIYLPSGPVIPENSEGEESFISTLAASAQSTIARINYRCSPAHPWPTPLHDVLTGYDWVLHNLLADQGPLARLGVCGELIGASLATTLALTECKLGTSRIAAAAVNNPIADWVFPDDLPVLEPSQLPEPIAPEETSIPADQDIMTWWVQEDAKEEQEKTSTSRKRQKRAAKRPPTAWERNSDNAVMPTLTLSAERDVLFAKPEHYFDRFASPIHFFRSPHGNLVYPQSENLLVGHSPAKLPKDPLDIETQMDISHYESYDESETPVVPILARCRAYARIYPPASSNLSLPEWYITSGSQSPLLDQASELARMMKRSIARHSLRNRTARVLWHDPNEKKKYEAYAEQRVHLKTSDGIGLWSMSNDSEATSRIDQVGAWMRKTLSPLNVI